MDLAARSAMKPRRQFGRHKIQIIPASGEAVFAYDRIKWVNARRYGKLDFSLSANNKKLSVNLGGPKKERATVIREATTGPPLSSQIAHERRGGLR
jgi:hypothetical protein